MIILDYLIRFSTIIVNSICLCKYLHLFQLRNYNAKRYLSYFNFTNWLFIIFLASIFVAQILIFKLIFNILINLILLFICPIIYCKNIINNKTPIVYTARLKRLYLLSIIIIFLPIIFNNFSILSHILMIFAPVLANYLNFFDKIKNSLFIKKAKNKLKNSSAKVIAITGSNGKTTVKNILLNLLNSQYKVIASPKSFNTPIGISKFLNETNLNVDFIILEYGARHKNDIQKLCKLFGADFGILTQIAPQHLQTFKSIENVAKAKQKLSDFLNIKPCVYNIDNPYIFEMYKQKKGKKFAVSLTKSNAEFYAENISIANFKSTFLLCHKNKKLFCKTKLLGKHNVTDILLATAIAVDLNVTEENLVTAIENLDYIPHRLEYLNGPVNILDDSYNCSLASAKESVEILSNCPGKKMIITPGIIEGGKQQYEINFKLGKMIAYIDYIVVIGSTNQPSLTRGIQAENPSKKILFAPTLENAKQYFNLLTKSDTLLFLNDLPDDYK